MTVDCAGPPMGSRVMPLPPYESEPVGRCVMPAERELKDATVVREATPGKCREKVRELLGQGMVLPACGRVPPGNTVIPYLVAKSGDLPS